MYVHFIALGRQSHMKMWLATLYACCHPLIYPYLESSYSRRECNISTVAEPQRSCLQGHLLLQSEQPC